MRVSKCVEVDVDFDVEVTDFADDMDADEIIEALSKMDLTQKCSDCEYSSNGICELYYVAEPLNGECYNW